MHGLFPTPVGLYDLEPLTEEQHSWIASQPTKSNKHNRISADKNVLDNEIMAPIRSQIETFLLQYFREAVTESNSAGLKITQSWCNYTGLNQAHHKHHHPNSVVSGVYYPQTTAEDKIYFYNSRLDREALSVETPTYTQFNSKTWWLPTPKDRLVLFPSSLEHSVNPRTETDVPDRISLSFNTFFTGEIGQIDDATYLALP